MRSTLLPLILCCLALGACGTSSQRSAKPVAPAEPVALATTDGPESVPAETMPAEPPAAEPAPVEPVAVEPMDVEPVAVEPVAVEPVSEVVEPTPVAQAKPTPPPVVRKPEPVAQAKPVPAPVEKPPKPARSRRDAAAAPAPTVTPHAPVPELPAVVDRATTSEQLAAHALVVAREEVAADAANGYSVLERQAHLVATWTPAMTARQAELAAIAQTREDRSQKQVAEAERLAAYDARLSQLEAEYERKAAAEQAKTAPILPQ